MNKDRKKILAISGSTRKNSSNEAILKVIADMYKDVLEIEIYEGIDKLPHFNPDLDKENPPAAVQELRELLKTADGVLICTPEYVFSLPGSLKNAIEWNVSTTIFSNKPVAIIVASASGEKAFESLMLVMSTIESVIPESSGILIRGVKGKIGANGEITHPETLDKLKSVTESLIRTIEEVNSVVERE